MNSMTKSIRFNTKKDKNLIKFFDEKGLKYGVKFLYEFYENNKDIVSVLINTLKNEIDISPTISNKTIIKSKVKKEFNINDDEVNLSGF